MIFSRFFVKYRVYKAKKSFDAGIKSFISSGHLKDITHYYHPLMREIAQKRTTLEGFNPKIRNMIIFICII